MVDPIPARTAPYAAKTAWPMLFSEWSCALLDIMRKLLLGTLNPLLGLNLASWNSFKACIIAEAAGGVCTTRAGTGLLAAPVQLGGVCYGIRMRKCARGTAWCCKSDERNGR